MLDAPVSGGVLAAESGTLTFMVYLGFLPNQIILKFIHMSKMR